MRKLAISVAALAVLAAACGGGDDGQTADGDGNGAVQRADVAVDVELQEFSVTPSSPGVMPATVEFDVSNTGSTPHEFLVIRTDLPADGLPVEGGMVVETAAELTVVAEIPQFPAGANESIVVPMRAGDYVLICNIPGHYEAGMTAAFTVG